MARHQERDENGDPYNDAWDQLDRLREVNAALLSACQEALKLHQPCKGESAWDTEQYCSICTTPMQGAEEWPCATALLLRTAVEQALGEGEGDER